ncbi:Protein EXORDIUM-like 3 [Abeliophyllum distichum]|uniref:Protein EXORDIUM-like 3 n=1 Tax=Abeliophyllum distichum TaxID=126358 RepID=A0ABD1NNA7_9LAMI
MHPAHQTPAALILVPLLFLFFFTGPVIAWRPWPNQSLNKTDFLFGGSKKYEGSSEFVQLKYHMGPVLTEKYHSFSHNGMAVAKFPETYNPGIHQLNLRRGLQTAVGGRVVGKTVQQYTDQTGANISRHVHIGAEKNDGFTPMGNH